MQLTRLITAHIFEWVHVYIFRHRPYRTCQWAYDLWPDIDHTCWMCRACGWNQPDDDTDLEGI